MNAPNAMGLHGEFGGSEADALAMKTVPPNSDAGVYLTAVAIHGRCVCEHGALCTEQSAADNPGRMLCPLCQILDPEWLCPTLDDDADYPDPDQVFIEGSPAADPDYWNRKLG